MTTLKHLALAVGLALVLAAALVGALALTTTSSRDKRRAREPSPWGPHKDFKGIIKLDVRDSKADWGPFTPKKAPEGAPNVLFVLYDDTGLAAWSPYGGRINMPTLDRLAKNGLTYTQWHTCALCSPTRSTLLTGRNHTLNGMAAITEASNGFPGWCGRIPPQAATIAQVLQEGGFSTFWLGKNHNVPEPDVAEGGDRKTWPLGQGFERFYGFLGGETNQWYPDLVEDNHFIEPPSTPEQGYHLSKDLADQAIRMIRNQKVSNPSKPWFMFYNPGANHAPHHAPQEYIDKYKGKFDDGYEAYRTWVLARMIAKGVLPKDTKLTPINPLPEAMANPADAVRPWDSLNADEKKLFSHMAEVFAGFSEDTDAQVGRVIDYLEQSGQLDNTIVFYAADNGTSGEGTPNGSVNENKFFNGYPDDLAENMKLMNKLGSPDTYNHFPTGWAVALSTPFQMFKRYSQFSGGTCCPLVISWPKGITAWRNPPPVSPFHGHRPHDPRHCRPQDAEGLSWRRAVPALGRVDEIHLRRNAGCADAEEAPVLLDAGHPRDLGGRMESGHRACAVHRQGPFRSGPVGTLPRRCGPFGIHGPGEAISGETGGPEKGVGRGGADQFGAAGR